MLLSVGSSSFSLSFDCFSDLDDGTRRVFSEDGGTEDIAVVVVVVERMWRECKVLFVAAIYIDPLIFLGAPSRAEPYPISGNLLIKDIPTVFPPLPMSCPTPLFLWET